MKIDTCYNPAALATPEDLQKKKEIFERRERTVSILNFPLTILGLIVVDTLATPQFLACGRDPETREEGSIFA